MSVTDETRDEKGRFKAGYTGNPFGRPKVPIYEAFGQAIRDAERKHKRSVFRHFIEKGFQDNRVLISVMKKILPDLQHVDSEVIAQLGLSGGVGINLSYLSDEELNAKLEEYEQGTEGTVSPPPKRTKFKKSKK